MAICKYFVGFLPIKFPTALFSTHNNANKFAPAAHYSIITPSARRVSGGRMGDRRTTQPTRFGDALLTHTNAFSSQRSDAEGTPLPPAWHKKNGRHTASRHYFFCLIFSF